MSGKSTVLWKIVLWGVAVLASAGILVYQLVSYFADTSADETTYTSAGYNERRLTGLSMPDGVPWPGGPAKIEKDDPKAKGTVQCVFVSDSNKDLSLREAPKYINAFTGVAGEMHPDQPGPGRMACFSDKRMRVKIYYGTEKIQAQRAATATGANFERFIIIIAPLVVALIIALTASVVTNRRKRAQTPPSGPVSG